MTTMDTAGRASIAIPTTAETKTVGIHDGTGANFATTMTGPAGTKVVSGATVTMTWEKADSDTEIGGETGVTANTIGVAVSGCR
jgi:hypothetical protein